MGDSVQITKKLMHPTFVGSGNDRYGEHKTLGISDITFKISSSESADIFAVEVTLTQKGGPAKHLHFEQDEWFYILEGEFIIEVGEERFKVNPGDSLFAPKKVPHAWAFIGGPRGRFLGSVMPAGNLEAFFINAAKNGALPGPDQSLWRPYGVEWVGPPIKID